MAPDVFHRTAYAEQMAQQLLQPSPLHMNVRSGVLLSGIRRVGKTTFLRQDLVPALEARGALVLLERHYLSHPVAGGWYDQFDGGGNSLIATIPASSFYHVLCAVTEAEQVLS